MGYGVLSIQNLVGVFWNLNSVDDYYYSQSENVSLKTALFSQV
jgi:hypothetical protein